MSEGHASHEFDLSAVSAGLSSWKLKIADASRRVTSKISTWVSSCACSSQERQSAGGQYIESLDLRDAPGCTMKCLRYLWLYMGWTPFMYVPFFVAEVLNSNVTAS